MQARWQKFKESRQEPLRLAIALEDFFLPDCPTEARAGYEAYLRRRIRPAAAELVRTEDLDKLEQLSSWLTGSLVEELLQLASKEQRSASLIWLLRLKQECYGFTPPDFSL